MTLRWTLPASAATILGLAASLAAAALGRPSLAAYGSTLLAVVALDALALGRGAVQASISLSAPRIMEGDDCKVEVLVQSRRRSQQVRVELAPGLDLKDGTNLIDARYPASFTITGQVRGPHAIGPCKLRTWSPLRLWAQERLAGEGKVLEVIPRPTDPSEISMRSRVVSPTQGRFQVNRPGQGFDFFALREYRSGDTMRSINWKATARRDDLIVNQRQMETLSEVAILLDARCVAGLGRPGQSPLDRGCRLALGIFTEALDHRDTVHFASYGSDVQALPPGHQGILERLEQVLSRLEAGGSTGAHEAWQIIVRDLHSSSGPVIVITSAEGDRSLLEAVRQMAARGHAVTVISPSPNDDLLDGNAAEDRRRRRATALADLRNLGAAVKDWSGGPVEIGPPVLAKVSG